MYKRFVVSHFRRFQDLEIDGLNRVNLITGPNGAGKTSLLEALFINCGAFSPELALRVSAFRGMETLRVDFSRQRETAVVVRSLFHDFDTGTQAKLVGYETDGGEVTVQIRAPEPEALSSRAIDNVGTAAEGGYRSKIDVLEMRTAVGRGKAVLSKLSLTDQGLVVDPLPRTRTDAVFLQPRTETSSSALAERFGRVVVARQENKLVEALKPIEPRLTSLVSVLEKEQTVIYADVGKNELVPLWLLGGGINHLAHILLAVLEKRGRVVLIDEVENGIYHDVLPDMWRTIHRATMEADCQIFATTHSRECVAAAHEVFSETFDYDLSVHRLEAANGLVKAISYDRETLQATLDAGFELR